MIDVADALRARLEGRRPRALITLGSGLRALADEVTDAAVIGFGHVGLPESTVPGHTGRFLAGDLVGTPVLVQQGRLHLYEGVPPTAVVAPVRAAADVGIDTFVVTNAAGALSGDLAQGDLLVISDQLNLTGTTPLVGPSFVDMTGAYDARLRDLAHTAAERVGERLAEGVYAGLPGPAFETPAEISMLRTLGADVVGMSTVLEVIAARCEALRVLGFSVITNVHRPGGTPTSHAEVLAVGDEAGRRLAAVIRELVPHL